MNSRATFESSHAGRIGAYAAGADGMSRSKSASAPAAVILDPRAKLYLLLLANMLLFFHADARAEALLTALFLTPLFLAGRWRMGLRLTACYAVLLGLGLFLGICSRYCKIFGIVLLLFYYLAYPPFASLGVNVHSDISSGWL